MIVNVFTAMHTGTTFLCELLQGSGINMNIAHFSEKHKDAIFSAGYERPTIIPLRHPVKVLGSFYKRNMQKHMPWFIEQWDIMIDFDLLHDPVYLIIDSDRREKDLSNIGAITGTSLVTDWEPRNSSDNAYDKSIADLVPVKFIRFYEAVRCG